MLNEAVRLTMETYDRRAAGYETWRPARPVTMAALARFSAQVDGRVLDLGCATGRESQWLAASHPVVALDLSARMVERVRRQDCPVRADMRWLPFSDMVFAGVWARASVLHIPHADVPRVFSEVHRVLVPGGRFHVSVRLGTGEEMREGRYFAYHTADGLNELLQAADLCIAESSTNVDALGRGSLWLTRTVVRCAR